MKKFIVIYHAQAEAMQQMMANATPEQQAKGTEAWMQWIEKMGKQMLDMGAPLAHGLKVKQDGSTESSEKNVTGYSIIEAESIDSVKELLKGHPHLGWSPDADIEVHEAMPVPGM